MKFLIDHGLPKGIILLLEKNGISAQHTGDLGLERASDLEIIEFAKTHQMTIVTLDADFHALIAASEESRPSVIRIREQGLRSEAMANLLLRVISQTNKELSSGAFISATSNRIRIKRLPVQ